MPAAACRTELTHSLDDVCSHFFYLAEAHHSVVDFYALTKLCLAAVELEALFVVPSSIGKGCSRKMIEHAKKIEGHRGSKVII
ncbi:MAG: hypothetical protein M2R45_05180 [Verrucomicrobia subdivision 3 bacterium]|nr:hypothetical protein [Limisphaerales bacterium]MCS1416300.1 hypothetical protein [Limisphaerales bacterium]